MVGNSCPHFSLHAGLRVLLGAAHADIALTTMDQARSVFSEGKRTTKVEAVRAQASHLLDLASTPFLAPM